MPISFMKMRDKILERETDKFPAEMTTKGGCNAAKVGTPERENLAKLISTTESPFASLELSPADVSLLNLDESDVKPLFYSVTWHGARNTFSTTEDGEWTNGQIPAFTFAEKLHQEGRNVLLHIVCADMTREKLDFVLNSARLNGMRNIFALRGDGFKEDSGCHFRHASDIVTYTRKVYGDYFSIGVAGYPEGHPNSPTIRSDLEYLKYKVDCGADFIITQAFFDVDLYLQFVRSCRGYGIAVPIIPGIFIFDSISSLTMMTSICHINIPDHIKRRVAAMNSEAVRVYGTELMEAVVEKILRECNDVRGFHFFTLNKPKYALNLAKKIILKK